MFVTLKQILPFKFFSLARTQRTSPRDHLLFLWTVITPPFKSREFWRSFHSQHSTLAHHNFRNDVCLQLYRPHDGFRQSDPDRHSRGNTSTSWGKQEVNRRSSRRHDMRCGHRDAAAWTRGWEAEVPCQDVTHQPAGANKGGGVENGHERR